MATEINKKLAKVEVSFQDDFSGAQREYTLTPKYILNKLKEKGLVPKIGEEILLYEKDIDEENKEIYLCNLGKVKRLKEHSIPISVLPENTVQIDGEPVFVEIDQEKFFRIPPGSFLRDDLHNNKP